QVEQLYAQGLFEQAVGIAVEACNLARQQLGNSDPYATSLNNLAMLYKEMGDYPAAEPIFQQSLEIRRRVLGENHPDYAASLNNLAVLYQDMGNYAAAEPLYQQSLEIRRRVLGENHPSYAASLNNLALLYQDMGNYSAAE